MLNAAQEGWVKKTWIREVEANSSSKYMYVFTWTGTMHSMQTGNTMIISHRHNQEPQCAGGRFATYSQQLCSVQKITSVFVMTF